MFPLGYCPLYKPIPFTGHINPTPAIRPIFNEQALHSSLTPATIHPLTQQDFEDLIYGIKRLQNKLHQESIPRPTIQFMPGPYWGTVMARVRPINKPTVMMFMRDMRLVRDGLKFRKDSSEETSLEFVQRVADYAYQQKRVIF